MFKRLACCVALLLAVAPALASETRLALDTTLPHAPDVFADALPVQLDARHDGEWTLQGETLHWSHRIVADHATALALELETLRLPPGANLQIGDESWQGPLVASARFTRHQPGSVLEVSADVPRAAADGFELRIVAVQAAFRDPFAAPAPVVAKAGEACAVNAACVAGNSVQPWGGAVVALIVLNTATCTGTLMNNSAGDARPYLLTARHCYTGAGGSDPVRAAASLRMAWNAVAACGAPLSSAWGAGATFTAGATHRAEFGDSWLVELGSRPPDSVSPWYAGFDAGDQLPTGPLTGLHHGGALQRQVLSTTVPASVARVTSYLLPGVDLLGWAFSPLLGSASAGASGSGLFDAQGRVIGTLSTGVACDAGLPQVTYARLAQAWSGNGTAAGSLKPWLDPVNSGSQLSGKGFSGTNLPLLAATPATSAPLAAANTDAGGSSGGALGAGAGGLLLGAALWRRRQRAIV